MKKSKRYNSTDSVTQTSVRSSKLGRAFSATVLASAIMAGGASAQDLIYNAGPYSINADASAGAGDDVYLQNGAVVRAATDAEWAQWTITGTDIFLESGTFAGVRLAGNLIKNSADTVTILGDTFNNGGLVINAGSVILGNNGSLDYDSNGRLDGTIVVNANGSLEVNYFDGVFDNNVTLADATSSFIANGASEGYWIDGIISGDGSLTKVGAGDVIIEAAQTYTGATNVNEGRLIVNGWWGGSIDAASEINVATDAAIRYETRDVDRQINVALGGELQISNSDLTVVDAIVGLGTLVQDGGDSSIWEDQFILGGIEIREGELTIEDDVDVIADVNLNGDIAGTDFADYVSLDVHGLLIGDVSANGLNEGVVEVHIHDGGIIDGDISLNQGYVHVDGEDGLGNASTLLGDIVIDGNAVANRSNEVVVEDGGVVDGSITILGDTANSIVTVGSPQAGIVAPEEGLVTGDITVERGGVNVATAVVEGDINVGTGWLDAPTFANPNPLPGEAVRIQNGAEVGGNITVGEGSVSVLASSFVGGHITVGEADGVAVAVASASEVDGGITVGEGDVLVTGLGTVVSNDDTLLGSRAIWVSGSGDIDVVDRALVLGNVRTEEGDVFVGGAAGVIGNVSSADGDVAVVGVDSEIIGSVLTQNGNVWVDDGAAITGVNSAVIVNNGDLTVTDRSSIGTAAAPIDLIEVVDGDLHVGIAGGIVGLDDDGYNVVSADEINVFRGDANVVNRGTVNGGINVVDGDVNVHHYSTVNGDVTLDIATGGTATTVNVEGYSRINGSVDIDQGDLNVTNYSGIVAVDANDYVRVVDGSINVLNNSFIDSNVHLYADTVLNVDATSWVDSIQVNAGATLTGDATIIGDLRNAGGFISPGGPVETGLITVGGDYFHYDTINGTAVYAANINSYRDFDHIAIAGEAYFSGGVVLANFTRNFRPVRGNAISILSADGGIFLDPNDPTTVTSNLAAFSRNRIWGFNYEWTDTDLLVWTYLRSFTNLGINLTHNQTQVAKALNHAVSHHRLNPLLDHIHANFSHISQIPALLTALSPEQLTSIFNVNVATAQIQNANIQRRLDDVRSGARGFNADGFAINSATGTLNYDGNAIAANKDGLTLAGWDGKSIVSKEVVAPVYHESRWGFFATGTGEWAQISSTRNAQGQDFTSAGFTIGADYRVSENFVIGINGGYTNTQSDYVHGGGLDVDGGRGGIYATAFGGGAYVDAAVGGGYNSYKTRRHTIGGYANGDSDGAEFNALLGGGYDYQVGGFTIGPVASLQYTFTDLNEFQETGNSLGNLHFRGQSQESLRSYVGVKAAYAINAGGVVIKPEVRAQWKHEYLDNTPSIESRFVGDNYYFTVDGPEVGRDSLVLDAGASIQINPAFSVYAYYTGELARTNYESHAVNGGFRVAF